MESDYTGSDYTESGNEDYYDDEPQPQTQRQKSTKQGTGKQGAIRHEGYQSPHEDDMSEPGNRRVSFAEEQARRKGGFMKMIGI